MKLKFAFAMILMAILCGVSMAGTRINSLIMDDFESYTDPNGLDMAKKLNVVTKSMNGTGPWMILEELGILQWWSFFSLPYANNPFIDANINYSLKLASGGTTSMTDPNGFVAYNGGANATNPGVADDLNPKSLRFSYDLRPTWKGNTGKGYQTFGLVRMVSSLGIPVSSTPSNTLPAPIGAVYTADLSVYDKLSFRLRNEPGTLSPDTLNDQSGAGQDNVRLILEGDDFQKEYGGAIVPLSNPKFLEYPGGIWRTVEFNLHNLTDLQPTDGQPLDLTKVAIIVIEIKDRPGQHATFYIDDLTLSIKDDPADINMDGAKNLDDLAALAAVWLQ